MPDRYDVDRLRIAQVAPLWARVPPEAYGGAELMVHWLTEDLVAAGHHVTLFASGDSHTAADLQPVYDVSLMEAMRAGSAYRYEPYALAAFVEALQRSQEFDVIHCHLGSTYIPLAKLTKTPVVFTVHEGLDSVDERWIVERFPSVALAGISRSQICSLPLQRLPNHRVIYHGCDFPAFSPSRSPGDYLAFVGRMGPRKNPVGAIEVARRTGMPIRLAGKPQDKDEAEYFRQSVEPLIDGEQVVYLGPISYAEKIDLLRHAAAFLFPIEWDEHFGIAMIEAMACGVPVLGLGRGSVPEVVDAGITGYFGESIDDLVRFTPMALELDRSHVKEHAKARFSRERMAHDYVDFYRYILAHVVELPYGA